VFRKEGNVYETYGKHDFDNQSDYRAHRIWREGNKVKNEWVQVTIEDWKPSQRPVKLGDMLVG
jgi:hypothetical protein